MNSLLAEDNEPQIDPTKDYLAELVGEGRKFQTPQDLAKGKYIADLHIKNVEKKLDQLREDYLRVDAENKAKAQLEELIDKANKSRQPPLDDKPPVQYEKPEIDFTKIESLVDSQIKKNKVLEREQENFNLVQSKLKERFGSNYQTNLSELIDSLELSVDYVDDLARRSPKALFKALGLDQPVQTEGFQTPPRTTQRSDSFAPKGGPKRTWSYYQELRKSNPKLYNDPKTTVQMTKDYEALGVEFEDGDFNR